MSELRDRSSSVTPPFHCVFTGRWFSVTKLPRPQGRSTDSYEVMTNEDSTVIAEIRWYTPFRKYSVFFRPETVWEATCLVDLTRCLTQLTRDRRQPHA